MPEGLEAPAKLTADAVDEPTARGARGAVRRHDRDRRPGPDVPQGDRQGRPAHRRGGGRPRQGDRARRADRRRALEGRPLAPRVDAPRHRAQDAHDQDRSTGCRSGPRRTRWSRRRSPATGVADLLLPTPDFHLVKAGKDAQSDGHQGPAQGGEAPRRRLQRSSPAHATFQPLLDWSYLSVHNGDLDSRDNAGLRAIYDWTRDDVAFPALQRWIVAGNDAGPAQADGLRPRGPAAATKLRDRRGEVVRIGRDAREQLTSARTCASSCRSRRSTSAAACRSWTSSRRATSASSGRSRSSTSRRASSSRPTRRGGSARRSPARSPTRPARSASRSTWSRRSTG